MMGRHFALESEARKAQNVGTSLRRLIGYFAPYTLPLLLLVVFLLYSTWSQVFVPELTGQVVDCYLAVTPQSAQTCWYTATPGQDAANGLGQIVLLMIGLYVSGAIVTGLTFYLMNWTGQRVLSRLRKEIFAQIHRLSLRYYTRHEAGDVMSRLTNDADTIQQVITFGLVQVAGGVLLIAWVVIEMMRQNVVYALLSLVTVPFMFWITSYLSGEARKAFRQSRLEMGSVNADLQENIAAVREVQAFSREEENIENFRVTNAANRAANIKAMAYTTALAPVLEVFSYFSIAIVVGLGGLWALRGTPVFGTTFTLGLVIAFMGYVQRLNQPLQQISVLWTNLQSAVAGAERIFEFLDEPPDIYDRANAKVMPPIQGHVVFNDVWAEYNPDEPVLKGVNLEAQPGQTVAIVGPTGAGKTTIINLLPRFYDVVKGTLTIDGLDVRDATLDSLRSQIGMVLQDNFVFSNTIMNNIRYGRPQSTDEEVIAAAKLVRADDFIQRLPEGYNTILGERGSGLSHGQRQLLAIARAALADPRILILDEATSSVDTRTERLIQQALEKVMEGRTSFVIAHRLSTIRNADQVLVLKAGQVVERGTHDSLLAQRGAYYDLYQSQFRREDSLAPSPNGHHAVPVVS